MPANRSGRRERTAHILAPWALAALLAGGCGVSGTVSEDEPGPGASLAIVDLRAAAVSDTSAVIRWSTSQPAAGILRCGTSPDLAVAVGKTTAIALDHEVRLESLVAQTTYHFRVIAMSALGDTVSRRGTPFTTEIPQAMNDSTPPQITDVRVSDVTSGSALLAWKTDDPTRCRVAVRADGGAEEIVEEYAGEPEKYVRIHGLTLLGLEESTTYAFVIAATNPAGLSATSGEASFATSLAPTLALSPDTLRARPSEEIEIEVRVLAVEDLAGAEVTLGWDPAVLACASGASPVRAAAFWEANGGHLFMPPVVDPARGRLKIEATWLIHYDGDTPTGTDADGEGVLCTVRLRVRADAAAAASPVSIVNEDEDDDGVLDTRLFDCRRLPVKSKARGMIVVCEARGAPAAS